MKTAVPKKPISGGDVLLKKHGPGYFRELAKKGIEKRREMRKVWEKHQKEIERKKKLAKKNKGPTL